MTMPFHPPGCRTDDAAPRLPAVVDELMAQWQETRSLLQAATHHLRRLLAARPWQEEMERLRRRVEALERERDALWQEVWQLRRRLEQESSLLSLPQRLALARDELATLQQELHRLSRAIERASAAIGESDPEEV